MILYSDFNVECVVATLVVALIQGGGKPRPYNADILYFIV